MLEVEALTQLVSANAEMSLGSASMILMTDSFLQVQFRILKNDYKIGFALQIYTPFNTQLVDLNPRWLKNH